MDKIKLINKRGENILIRLEDNFRTPKTNVKIDEIVEINEDRVSLFVRYGFEVVKEEEIKTEDKKIEDKPKTIKKVAKKKTAKNKTVKKTVKK